MVASHARITVQPQPSSNLPQTTIAHATQFMQRPSLVCSDPERGYPTAGRIRARSTNSAPSVVAQEEWYAHMMIVHTVDNAAFVQGCMHTAVPINLAPSTKRCRHLRVHTACRPHVMKHTLHLHTSCCCHHDISSSFVESRVHHATDDEVSGPTYNSSVSPTEHLAI